MAIVHGGDHDDGNVLGGGVVLDRAHHLIPVHPGHHDVEQDEVGRLPRQDVERFLAAGGAQEDKAFRRQHDFQHVPVLALIIDDQNACLVVRDVGGHLS